MDSRLSPEQDTLFVAPEASSPGRLLESGFLCIRQGRYTEGVGFFALVRERLSPDQTHLAAVLDAFTQSHKTYSRAQEELLQASRHFASADAEQQTQFAALENLLSILLEETNKVTPNVDTTLPALYITCFGHFEVKRLGRPVVLCPNRHGQTILRYLVAQSDHCATSDTLITLLWPEDEPEVAQPRLHTTICALRRSLNHGYTCEPGYGYIVCKNRTYCLSAAIPIQTDVDQFLHYYQAGRQTYEERVALYEKACRLYTGPFLPEDKYADWSFLQREHLSRVYIDMCRTLTDHYLKVKSYEEAEKWATAVLKEDNCDELAYARS